MRLRGIKNQAEKIRAHSLVIENPVKMKGQWQQYFKNNNPVWIELGMGLGRFIFGMHQAYPNINFVGFEKYRKAFVRTLRNFNNDGIANVALCREDAVNILEIFNEKEVERIFLNFSDPWPKKRHTKRRLTNQRFLDIYATLLTTNGELHFKTDNVDLFDFSLEELAGSGWKIIFKSYDFHRSEEVKNNIMTEYERKFSDEGLQICKLIARR